ncbi:CheB methylesterase domain-containing protein [Alicyclobacillus fodiniaquatilis]|uniref:protein-glutamate methylesterase n=1 Tax=Alicyclobacillus fodiniaquatilis TaxID=1661150 RepID=A0ABW4JE66_9BACL
MEHVSDGRVHALVMIGSSTGGPSALTDLLRSFDPVPGVACCVVQHMPRGFTANLARRLNDCSRWQVVEAQDGVQVRAGVVYVAPAGRQMRLGKQNEILALYVQKGEPVSGHQPSVDVLFHSAAMSPFRDLTLIGVLMTGMGRDGAQGLLALRAFGGLTIAESEATAVIYGMPKAAIEAGAAMEVLPRQEIASLLETHLRTCRETRTRG